jgi:hypothetical protein
MSKRKLKDVTGAKLIEISIRDDSKVIWVNDAAKCVLRICRIEKLVLDDRRLRAKPLTHLLEHFKALEGVELPYSVGKRLTNLQIEIEAILERGEEIVRE